MAEQSNPNHSCGPSQECHIQRHFIPEEAAKAVVEASLETEEKVREIYKELRQEHAAATGRMIDCRNEGNREWMKLHESGQKERLITVLETKEAIVALEEQTVDFVKQQQEDLEKLKVAHEAKLKEDEARKKQTEEEMDRRLAEKLQDEDCKFSNAIFEKQQILEQDKKAGIKETEKYRADGSSKRQRIKADTNKEIRKTQEETKKKIAEIERQAEEKKKKKEGMWFWYF